ncbi:MAG TPA: ABC transporter ATP-binding protein [Candidatus Limnocylindria bacterium]|nr:ABC transporter ATP-binding protein [Candidatus Limnocylindria bacterium]
MLEASGLTMRFGGLVAVDNVSMRVGKGEIVSLIGPNGAGKTTVFNMVTGVYAPTSGTLTFEGERLNDKTPQEIVGMGIARTFQNLRLFAKSRVIENVLIGMHLRTDYGFFESLLRLPRYRNIEDERTAEAIRILEGIGLKAHMDDPAGSLPYGEQRKVEIARAIATKARLLLLDEPAAGMNPAETAELLRFIRHLRDEGFTILLIEHDMQVVMNISDRVYVLDHGKLIAQGLPGEIANDPLVVEAYLGAKRDDA